MNGDGVVNGLDMKEFSAALKTNAQTMSLVRTTYNVYSANEQHVRIVQTRNPDHDFGMEDSELNGYLFDLERGDPAATDLVIQDAVRDSGGLIIRTTNGLGTIQQSELDLLGRPYRQYSVDPLAPTVAHLETTTLYDAYGNVASTTNPSTMTTAYVYEPIGTSIVKTMTIAQGAGASLEATTEYEYDAAGRQIAVIAPGPDGNPDATRTSTVDYDESCCGQFMANIDALGNARISKRNSAGESIHGAVIDDYAAYDAAQTGRENFVLSETTSSYRPDGAMAFQTVWTTALSDASGNSLPIAGVDGEPASGGVTTRYLYDYDLSDTYSGSGTNEAGLSSSQGESFTDLTGATASVSLHAALLKLGQATSFGGADLNFGDNCSGSAVAVVSPDEKTVRFTITDGAGRTVMSGLLAGPAASSGATASDPQGVAPNDLLSWSCTSYDQIVVHDSAERLETVSIDQDGETRKSRVNGIGWAIATFDELNNETTTTFDRLGNPDTVSQTGQDMNYDYDFLGRQTQATDDTLQLTTKTFYDTAGRIEEQEDAKQVRTHQDYDVLDRPTDLTDRLGQTTTRQYNIAPTSSHFINTITDAESWTTTYVLDKLGRRQSTTLQNGQVTLMEYDAAGRVEKIIYGTDENTSPHRVYTYEKPSGVLDKIEYFDASGNLTSRDDFEYNDVLQRTAARQYDGTGTLQHELTFDYTLRGQLFKETTTVDSQSYAVEHRYDARGRLEKLIYPSTREADFTYTQRSKVDLIDWNGNQIEDRDYNALGQLTQIARPGFSQPEIRAYSGQRLTSITTNTGVGTATYSYDANHNKTGETWTNNSILDNYDFSTGTSGYDAEDRFLEFNRPNMAGGAENQSFDRSAPGASIGNIVGITGGDYAGTRSFNNIHQLKDVGTSGAVTQDFDSFNGNLTKSYSGTTFGWDIAAGRMTSATVSGDPRGIDGAHQYGYDATGRRAWKSVDDDDDVQRRV